MTKEEIPFNYFHKLFINKCKEIQLEEEKNKIGDLAKWMDSFLLFSTERKELIPIYEKALYRICEDYVSLSNANVNVYPKETKEFIKLILETIDENPYKESYLISLQFIYCDYINILGQGAPILKSCKKEEVIPNLEITLDQDNKITDFEGINIDLLEENKIMTEFIFMQKNGVQGPLQKIHYKKRNF